MVAACALSADSGLGTSLPQIAIDVRRVEGPGFVAWGIRGTATPGSRSRLRLTVDQLAVGERSFQRLAFTCEAVRFEPPQIACDRGVLEFEERIPVSFRFRTDTGAFDVTLSPAAERWRATGVVKDGRWEVALEIDKGRIARFAALVPEREPRPRGGTVSGTVTIHGQGQRLRALDARLTFEGAAFSDPSGLKAGEGIGARVELAWRSSTAGGRFNAAMEWHAGEIFWQPVYVPAGLVLQTSGETAPGVVRVEAFAAEMEGVGRVEGRGAYRLESRAVTDLSLEARRLDLGGLYQRFLRPLLAAPPLSGAGMDGSADFHLRRADGRWREARLVLHDVSLQERGLALEGVSADIAWSDAAPREAWLQWREARLLKVPLGPVTVRFQMFPTGAVLEPLEVPILDGTLSLRDGRLARLPEGWQWQVSGAMSAVSMEALCRALDITPMHGTLSAVIPRVSYADSLLVVDGALLLRVFDGTAVVQNLRVIDPLGRVPRLVADMQMRRLDLDLLTRTFSFGSMEGRIDMDVKGLELVQWKPVRFDARLESSPGEYRKTISQRAVENISALGGAGAAAAIQRSFLRFFERFQYRRLGLSCRLARGVCEMGGIAEAPGGYVIVEGGGIPAITVIGYNRVVGWNELLARLQRITQENVRPVIQ